MQFLAGFQVCFRAETQWIWARSASVLIANGDYLETDLDSFRLLQVQPTAIRGVSSYALFAHALSAVHLEL